ncbi:zinc-ribbon domain-containing protein [Peribacillus butanolivorans]|uniref:zinc-ribbon domain-containing protein n=1 Tax=Peribacillus butanolivorans TaxID=421767 RepID=UPI00366CC630
MCDNERNNPSTPEDVIAGSNEKYYWICAKGHSFYMPIKQMTRKGRSNGCPYWRG